MIELSPHQYPLAAPCFNSLDYHLAVRSVIAGRLPASVFVDDLVHPHLALARAKKRVYLAGDGPSPLSLGEIRMILLDQILPQIKADRLPVLVLNYAPDFWGSSLHEILSDQHLWKDSRQRLWKDTREHYTFSSLMDGWKRWIPEGYELKIIDGEFLRRDRLKNLDGLIDEIQSEGEPIERFVSDRLGICALNGNEIAGWCLSEYNLDDHCEIGIETLEPHQRRGLGSAMTCALIELALSQGITHIGWDCYGDNLPSVATARKTGFTLDTRYDSIVCVMD